MIRETLRALSPLAWALVAAAVLAIVLLGWWQAGARERAAEDAARARAGAGFAEGRAAAGADAVGVVAGNAAGSAEIDARVKGSEDAIRNADPDERDGATVRELCDGPGGDRRPGC